MFINVLVLLSHIVSWFPYSHKINSRLYNCLFLLPQTVYCSAKYIYYPIIYYIMVSEYTSKDYAIFNREEDASELSSQLFEFLELWCKFRKNILKSIFIYVATLRISDFCVCPSILIPQSTCLNWSHLSLIWLWAWCVCFLHAGYLFVTIADTHSYKDVEK